MSLDFGDIRTAGSKFGMTFLEHAKLFCVPKWPPQSPYLTSTEHLWDEVEQESHIISQCFQHLCNRCTDELRQFKKQKWHLTQY